MELWKKVAAVHRILSAVILQFKGDALTKSASGVCSNPVVVRG